MSNLGTLQANIKVYLNRTDMDSQITNAINRAVKYYSRFKRYWFQETTATFQTIVGQYDYGQVDGLPDNISNIDVLKIQINTGTNVTIDPTTYEDIQERIISNSVQGPPDKYCFYENKIYFDYIPDQIYTMTMSYLKAYPNNLVAGTDTNDFTEYAEDLIEARACWWIYSRILKNQSAATDSKADELDAALALDAQTTKLIKSGKVRPSNF